MTQLSAASHEWSTRPDDERYLTLRELQDATTWRRQFSREALVLPAELRLRGTDRDVILEDGTRISHWSLGQIASLVGAPDYYLRRIPAKIAAINLQWGLESCKDRAKPHKALFGTHPSGYGMLSALTSPTYGRIWDAEVVETVMKLNQSGNWKVPAATYQKENPRLATTLYASDHDVFIFLVDPERTISAGGEPLARGFMVWNSETGSRSFGLTTFLYRFVCDNRIVWGAEDVKELRIRHVASGPERFLEEAIPALKRFIESSPKTLEERIQAAMKLKVVTNANEVGKWLEERGFSERQAKAGASLAQWDPDDVSLNVSGPRDPRTLWNVVQGMTAYARGIPFADTRVAVERKAGALLNHYVPASIN